MNDNNLVNLTADEEKLLHALEIWFESVEDEIKNDKNFWARNKVAKCLKLRLKSLNKWKNGLHSQRRSRGCDFKKRKLAVTFTKKEELAVENNEIDWEF